MRTFKTNPAEPGFGRASPQTLTFSGPLDGLGFGTEDEGSDWDELRLVGLIERDGFIPIDSLDAEGE